MAAPSLLGKSLLNPKSSPLVPLLSFWLLVTSMCCIKLPPFSSVSNHVVGDNGDANLVKVHASGTHRLEGELDRRAAYLIYDIVV